MRGFAKYWLDKRSLGGIRCNGDDYLVMRSDIDPDEIARQFLISGEPVEFEVSERRSDQAVNVRPCFREPVLPDFETVTLRSWNPTAGCGWADRELGGQLFVCANEIVTEGLETLGAGSKLWVLPAPPEREGHRWVATQAEIFIDEALAEDLKTLGLDVKQ